MRRLLNIRWLIRSLAVSALLIAVPVVYSADQGLATNDAECSGQGCCMSRAICELTDGSNRDGYENKSIMQQIYGCDYKQDRKQE